MDTSLEDRLKLVEADIVELKQQSAHPELNWIEQITGLGKDDPILMKF
jgi:hypothetical protein